MSQLALALFALLNAFAPLSAQVSNLTSLFQTCAVFF